MTRLFEDHCTKQSPTPRKPGYLRKPCGTMSRNPVCRWRRCRNRPAARTPSGPTFTRYCEWPLASRHRSRWPKPCSPVGQPRRGGLEPGDGPMTVGPVRSGDTLTLTRDGNGWRLSGRRDAGTVCLVRHKHDPDRGWSQRRNGCRTGRHRWQRTRQRPEHRQRVPAIL